MAVMAGDDSSVTSCIGCGNCSRACANTDPQTVMLYLINVVKGLRVPDSFTDTGYVMYPKVPDGCPEPVWKGDDMHVMPGCVVKCRAPFITYAASVVLDSLGLACSEVPDSTCCMYPAQLWDIPEEEREGLRVRMGESVSGRPIVSMCAGCEELMVRSGIDVTHMIPFVVRNLDRLPSIEPLGCKVALEPGCTADVYYRDLMAIAEHLGCTVVNDSHGCCGKGSSVSSALMEERQKECSGADFIVVGCPMCFIKYDRHPDGIPVMHVAELLAMALGDTRALAFHSKRIG